MSLPEQDRPLRPSDSVVPGSTDGSATGSNGAVDFEKPVSETFERLRELFVKERVSPYMDGGWILSREFEGQTVITILHGEGNEGDNTVIGAVARCIVMAGSLREGTNRTLVVASEGRIKEEDLTFFRSTIGDFMKGTTVRSRRRHSLDFDKP